MDHEPNAPTRASIAAGGQSALARTLKMTPQAVQRWCSSGKIPAERVLAVESASGVSRHELRPDLYPVSEPTKLAS
jgi:DNA-binding transcriptional regulator YdaS (Cro superfamily)